MANDGQTGNIREIRRTSLMNVPKKLHELGRTCEILDVRTAVVILGHPDGRVSVYGFGERTSALEATGWLARAQTSIAEGSGAGESDGYSWDPPVA